MIKRIMPLILLLVFVSCSSNEEIFRIEEEAITLTVLRGSEPMKPGVSETIQFRLNKGEVLNLRFEIPPVEDLEISPWTESNKGAELVVTPMKGGEYTFPELKLVTQEGVFITVPSWSFLVMTLAEEQSPMRPSLPSLSMGVLKSWQWLVLVVMILLIAAIVFYVLYQYKQGLIERGKLSRLLQKSLDDLESSNPLKLEESRDFYLKMTAVLRFFLDKVYILSTSGETREEFLPLMLALPLFKSTEHPWLITFWEKADQIKFAGKNNSPEERKEDYRKLIHILKDLIDVQKEKEVHELR